MKTEYTRPYVDCQEYYQTYEWFNRRSAVIERSNGRCERCGNSTVSHVVHTTWERLGEELLEDIVGLCQTCHRRQFKDKLKPLRPYWKFKTLSNIGKELELNPGELNKILHQSGLMQLQGGNYYPSGNAGKREAVYRKDRQSEHKWNIDIVKDAVTKFQSLACQCSAE